jgi:hypothetical protein
LVFHGHGKALIKGDLLVGNTFPDFLFQFLKGDRGWKNRVLAAKG